MLRRRLWAPVYDGIYIDHTGELTWLQQAWAAVLFSWPAALSHDSALRAADGPGRRDAVDLPIHVVVERDRRLVAPDQVRLHRRRGHAKQVSWNLSPPRVRYEQAAIDVASTAKSEFAVIAALAKAVQSRRTTAERLLGAMSERARMPRREWISSVLRDIDEGTCSVLEHGYLTLVERPHRLPRANRQAVGIGRVGQVYRDAAYAQPFVVELDGRLFHDTADARDRGLRPRPDHPCRRTGHHPALVGPGLRPTLLDGWAGRRTPSTARLDRLAHRVRGLVHLAWLIASAGCMGSATQAPERGTHRGRCAPGGGRTHTERCLRPLPLPIGIPGRRADHREPSSAARPRTASIIGSVSRPVKVFCCEGW